MDKETDQVIRYNQIAPKWKRKPPTSSRIPQGRQLSEDEQRLTRYEAEMGQLLRRFQKEIRSDEEEEKSA